MEKTYLYQSKPAIKPFLFLIGTLLMPFFIFLLAKSIQCLSIPDIKNLKKHGRFIPLYENKNFSDKQSYRKEIENKTNILLEKDIAKYSKTIKFKHDNNIAKNDMHHHTDKNSNPTELMHQLETKIQKILDNYENINYFKK